MELETARLRARGAATVYLHLGKARELDELTDRFFKIFDKYAGNVRNYHEVEKSFIEGYTALRSNNFTRKFSPITLERVTPEDLIFKIFGREYTKSNGMCRRRRHKNKGMS